MLDLPEAEMGRIFGLVAPPPGAEEIAAWLCKEDEAGFVECPRGALDQFLDGLVVHLRGPGGPPPPPEPLDNNVILKKLRVAFKLREEDMVAVMAAAGMAVSAAEVKALCRRREHGNFRDCGDQFLRRFLKGLTARVRR
jgi:uncharacterized protein YehS (DUF1456 family)